MIVAMWISNVRFYHAVLIQFTHTVLRRKYFESHENKFNHTLGNSLIYLYYTIAMYNTIQRVE